MLRRSVEITGVKQPCRRNLETAEFAKGRHRDGTARAGLQSDPRHEHHGHPAARGGDEGIVAADMRPSAVAAQPRTAGSSIRTLLDRKAAKFGNRHLAEMVRRQLLLPRRFYTTKTHSGLRHAFSVLDCPHMKRREFITVIGGAAVWPVSARAQQPERVRRIGVLLPGAAGDVEFQTRVGAFQQGLQQAGWTIGRNVRIDTRWATTDAAEICRHAAELAALAPDVILAQGTSSVGPLLQATRAVPIVFVIVVDPVGAGFVASLARPGGNATGFMQFEYSLSAKWPEPDAARAMGLQIQVIKASTRSEIEAAFATLVRDRADALFVAPDGFFTSRRVQFATLAARHAIPAAYTNRSYPEVGGLMSYGTDTLDYYRQVGVYTGQILKGVKPADMPVLQSTKWEFVINMQTARALGLEVPNSLQLLADEVIE